MNPKPNGRPEPNPLAWSFQNVQGLRKDVIAKINSTPNIPPAWKSALAAQIESLPGAINAVRLNAHCHFHDCKFNLSVDLKPMF